MDQNNLIQRALKRVRKTASTLGRKIYDDEGFYQRGRLTSKPITQPIQNAVVNNVVKPLTNTLSNTYKPITNYLDPRGYQAERASIRQGGNLGNQKLKSALTAMPNAAFQTFGATRMGLTTPLVSGALGGAIEKATGGNFQQGFRTGVGQAPAIGGFGAITNPAIANLAGRAAARFSTPLTQQLGGRLASGLASIPEGAAISTSLGQKYGPLDASFDFATGALLNKPQARVRVKGTRQTIDPQTLSEVDGLRDYMNRAIKGEKINQFEFNQALNDVENIAQNWLTKQDVDKVVSKSKGKARPIYYRNLLDTVAKKVGDYSQQYQGFRMGLTGDQKAAKAKLPKIMYESSTERIQKNPKFSENGERILKQAKTEIGSRDDKPFNLTEKFDEIYTDWVDRFYPVTKITEQIEEGTKSKIRPEFNPVYQVKRLMGAGGTAELRHKRTLEPIIKQLGDVDRSDFDVFMKAQRDIELAGRGIKGSDAEVAQQRLDALSERYDINKLNQVADQLYTYQRQGLEKLKQAGFLSDEAVSNITAKNQKYVPFQRIADELDNFLGIPTQKLQQSSTPVKKIKGSDKAIESPLESIIANTYKVESAIAKNNVAKSIVNLGNIDPKYNNLFEKAKGAGNDVITVWENGQKQYYKAPEQIIKVVKGLNEENMGTVLKVLSAPASFFRAQTTGRNPAFFIPNAVRDQFDAALNTKYGYIPFFDYMQGLGHLINDRRNPGGDPLVREWYESGGSIFFENMGGRKDIRKQIQDATQKKPLIQKAIDAFVTGIDVAGEFSEKPTRIGIYKRARQATNNPTIAAYESREGTLDFARMGAKMKIANSLVPFLNVSIQGFDKMLRSAVDHPGRTALVMAGTALLPQTLISLYNNQFHRDDYAQVPDFEKQGNFILLTGNKDREGNPIYYKVPLGHTQSILTQPTDQFITWLAGNNPQKFSQLALSMLTGALPVIGEGDNPGEIASRTLGGNLPQFMKPAAEGMFNYDSFRNKPIVDPYTIQEPPAAQFYPSTPEEYKKIGRKFNVSPARIQHVAEGYGGGLSKEIGNARSTIQDMMAGNPLDPNKIPLVRRFRGSYSGFDTERGDEEIDVDKSVQDRQAKQDLKASDKTTLRVGNTVYKKKTDKNGKVSITKKELGGDTTAQNNIQEQGIFDGFLKPAEKFEEKPDYKSQAKEYLEYNEIKTEVPKDPLKKVVYSKEKLSDAKKVYKDEDLEPQLKEEILKQMGYKPDQMRYEIATTLNNDEKAVYMAERLQGMTPERAKQFLEDSRTKSLSGDYLATKDVLNKLEDAGVITEEIKDYLLTIEKNEEGVKQIGRIKKRSGRKAKLKLSGINTNMSNLKAILRAKPASIDTARLRIQEPQRAKLPQIYQFPQSLL